MRRTKPPATSGARSPEGAPTRGVIDTGRDYQGFDAEVAQACGFVRDLGETEIQRQGLTSHGNVYLCAKDPENT